MTVSATLIPQHYPIFFNVRDFGAVGNDTVDDTVAIQAAHDAAETLGGIVYLPGGTYKITDKINLSPGICILGAGTTATTIKQHTANKDGLAAVDPHHIALRDFILQGTGAGTGIGIHFTRSVNDSMEQLLFENLYILDFGSDNIFLSNPIVSSLINVNSESAGQYGFNINGVVSGAAGTSTNLIGCYANANTTAGYRIYNMVYTSLNGCAADDNPIGYLLDQCMSVSLLGCGAEGNTTNSFKINGGYGNSLVSPWVAGNNGVAIYVTGTAQTTTIIGATDTDPGGSATAFVKTDTGTTVAMINVHEDTSNNLAADTANELMDAGGDMSLYGDEFLEGTLHLTNGATVLFGATGDVNLYRLNATHLATDNSLSIGADLQHQGTKAGFNGTTPITKPTVTGSRASNAALASLCTALANLGLITNSTS